MLSAIIQGWTSMDEIRCGDKPRRRLQTRRQRAIAALALMILGCWSAATAADIRGFGNPPLPLALKAFQGVVDMPTYTSGKGPKQPMPSPLRQMLVRPIYANATWQGHHRRSRLSNGQGSPATRPSSPCRIIATRSSSHPMSFDPVTMSALG